MMLLQKSNDSDKGCAFAETEISAQSFTVVNMNSNHRFEIDTTELQTKRGKGGCRE